MTILGNYLTSITQWENEIRDYMMANDFGDIKCTVPTVNMQPMLTTTAQLSSTVRQAIKVMEKILDTFIAQVINSFLH